MNNTLAKRSENPLISGFKKVAPFLLLALFAGLLLNFAPAVFAGGQQNNASNVIKAVITVMKYICNIVGIIFALIGIVKFAISHANEDGPAQQKAAMMIATGIVLVVLGAVVLDQLKVETWLV